MLHLICLIVPTSGMASLNLSVFPFSNKFPFPVNFNLSLVPLEPYIVRNTLASVPAFILLDVVTKTS